MYRRIYGDRWLVPSPSGERYIAVRIILVVTGRTHSSLDELSKFILNPKGLGGSWKNRVSRYINDLGLRVGTTQAFSHIEHRTSCSRDIRG